MRLKSLRLSMATILIFGGVSIVEANFGDALVGGVVGSVVGSVINQSMRAGHSSYRGHSSRTRHSRRSTTKKAEPVVTDEMKIQKALKTLGFYQGPIDGNINSFETRNAIKALNRAYKIDDTAYMSPQEKEALIYMGTLLGFDKYLSSNGTSKKAKGKRIQAALKVLGFYHHKIDGAVGRGTKKAIVAYKRRYGLGSSSKLSYDGEYRLVKRAREVNDKNIEDTINTLKKLAKNDTPAQTPKPQKAQVANSQPTATTTQQQNIQNRTITQNSSNTQQQTQVAQQNTQTPAVANSLMPQHNQVKAPVVDDGPVKRQQGTIILKPSAN